MTTDNQRSSIDEALRDLGAALLAAELDLMRPRGLDEVKNIHPPENCKGEACCIHNPSDHPLNGAPLQLRADRWPLMERRCPHGIGHPDPDSLDYIKRTVPGGRESAEYEGVHGCDGCCTGERIK